MLGDTLQQAIEVELQRYSWPALVRAAEELSQGYRSSRPRLPLASPIHRAAYLVTRLPATFAVIKRVLAELPLQPTSLLDLGAGPGTVLFAAKELFSIESATLVEQDPDMLAIGQRMGDANWIRASLHELPAIAMHDLVTLSYVVGELSEEALPGLVRKGWSLAKESFVIIEPGTKVGYKRILECRDLLIAEGAHIAAPCPHANRCPWADTEEWCHFAERLPRTSMHRQAKGGTLGYEDEKYSYIIATREPVAAIQGRILRHPMKRSGHVVVTLCTPNEGVQERTISRRDKELYQLVKKSDWGDALT